MKNKSTPLVDEHLQALQSLQETGTDDFFYTRLRARMENKESAKESPGQWSFPLKPVWVIGVMTGLLLINGYMLLSEYKTKHSKTAAGNSVEQFARAYDQTITSTY